MHFWIDKRSQQCGFGRSRVAASLSGAGGSGVGLSFGHPPRRISSSNKSTNRNALPDCHHNNAAGSSGSRSHQYQHQHQQMPQHHHQHQQQQQQQQQQACNNNNFNVNSHNYQQSHAHSSNINNYITNSNTANATVTGGGATMPSANAVTLNNNPHQHACQQAHLHSSSTLQSPHALGNINLMNNNNASTSTSTALAGDMRGLAPLTAHNINQQRNAAAMLQSNVNTSNTPLHQQHTNQCYDMRSYHHPQFGNMSVRHYQHSGRNCNGPTHANASSSSGQGYRNTAGYQSGARTIVGSTAATPSINNMQHMDQMPYRQHGYSHSSTAASAQSNESIMGASAPICTNTTNTTSYAVANTAHRYSSAAINMRSSNMTVDAGGGDAQLLPSHLKCGMCASLVLASVFVAGAKFYLDHQGTGLEVLIFCAFSATFFLAACTVSLCRVPKGLLPSGRNAVLGTQHHHSDADGTMHCVRAPYGRRDIGNGDGSGGGELIGSDDIHGAPLCGQLQLIEDSASAGPPPYHIAIYFPETENNTKSKEAPIDDESPPPSYDKILI